MTPRVLSKYDEWARYEQTVQLRANQAVKIIEFEAPRKSAFAILNGTVIRMKLRDTAGNELEANTKICLAAKDKRQMLADQVSPVREYRPWREISESDQYNDKYANSLVFPTGDEGDEDLLFEELEKLEIFVEVSEDKELDWGKSKIEIPVVEMTMEEVEELGLLGAETEVEIPEEELEGIEEGEYEYWVEEEGEEE